MLKLSRSYLGLIFNDITNHAAINTALSLDLNISRPGLSRSSY